ncbi:acyl-CoA carboxylase epsilon subunit [Streptomyces sp. NPDC096538]|uniref:acyl-CoA carboxylase epsilon subunit n=1 Tax=Streptomyces sp. NPDC096538 TaxID=3155427 RepID=UPI0033294535
MGDADGGTLAGRGESALRIVRGRPREEEAAALVAVLLAPRTGEQAGGPAPRPPRLRPVAGPAVRDDSP